MLFEVKIQKNKIVYMTATNSLPAAAIVTVDALKLLELWKHQPSHPEPSLAFGDRVNWRNDYKFNKAEYFFNLSKGKPVPVAEIIVSEKKINEPLYKTKFKFFRKKVGYRSRIIPYARFGDGITRSIWLLANDAKYFPIKCSRESANKLYRLAGAQGTQIIMI